jgi:hypothetical protein
MNISETSVGARFLKEWRSSDQPYSEWNCDNQLHIEHTNRVTETSKEQFNLLCVSADGKTYIKNCEVQYTHIHSQVVWNAGDGMVEYVHLDKKATKLGIGEISSREFVVICNRIEVGITFLEIFDKIHNNQWTWTPEIDVVGDYETKCRHEIGFGLVDRKITVTFETIEAAEKFCDHIPYTKGEYKYAWDGFQRSDNQVFGIAICDFVGEIWAKICSYGVDLSDQVLAIQLEKIHRCSKNIEEDVLDWDYCLKNPPFNPTTTVEVEIEYAGSSKPMPFADPWDD